MSKAKAKNAKRMPKRMAQMGWRLGAGKCFIFLQQNSLIFFYVETEHESAAKSQEKC